MVWAGFTADGKFALKFINEKIKISIKKFTAENSRGRSSSLDL